MKFKTILMWVWQLPQNTIGWLMTRKPKGRTAITMHDGETVPIYYTKNVFNCGVSLGDYIILDYDVYAGRNDIKTHNHEHGHQKQSRMLGWLYLPVVGFTSAICNNLWDRLMHRHWKASERVRWYYNRFPENWADRLGEVNRWK